MIRKDDRTPEQEMSHRLLVVGTDSFMSGWGEARNGASYAAWACTYAQHATVRRWVRNRSEMKRVRDTVDMPGFRYRPNPDLCAHLHIYVVEDGHPALA